MYGNDRLSVQEQVKVREMRVPESWPFSRVKPMQPRTLPDDGADVARLADEEPAPW